MSKFSVNDWNANDPRDIQPADMGEMSEEEWAAQVAAYVRKREAEIAERSKSIHEQLMAEKAEEIRVSKIPPSALLRLLMTSAYFLSLVVPGIAYIQAGIYLKLNPSKRKGGSGHYIGYHRHLATTLTILPSVWSISVLLILRGPAHINATIMTAWFLSSLAMLVFGIPVLVEMIRGVSKAVSGQPMS